MSSRVIRLAVAICATLGMAVIASAQSYIPPTGWYFCIDPTNQNPRSQDFGLGLLNNDIFGVGLGYSGTVTYGGQNGPCFYGPNPGAITVPIKGSIDLFGGPVGSVQSTFDDGMAFSFGAPIDTGGSWAWDNLVADGTQTPYSSYSWVIFFTGASARYIYAESTGGGDMHLIQRIDLYGDAARVVWQMQNTGTTTHNYGLYSGRWMAMMNSQVFTSGYGWGNFGGGKDGYVYIDGVRPPQKPTRYIRSQDPASFPLAVNFDFGQSDPYGLRIENGPLDEINGGFDTHVNTYAIGGIPAQTDVPGDTQADEFVVGDAFFLLGTPKGTQGAFPDSVVINDTPFLGDIGYIQKYYDQDPVTGAALHPVAAGAARIIVQYYRSTWGVSDYKKPYVAVVDAPKVLAYDPSNTSNNQISPNPFTVRVDIDNTYAYADFVNGIPIVGQVTLKVAKSTGLTFTPGQGAIEDVEYLNGVQTAVESCTKATPNTQSGQTGIQPSTMGAVDFQMATDGVTTGALPYYVTIKMTPGGNKTLTGTIYATTTPRLSLRAAANLVSVPWNFTDTSWTNVLNLSATDFQAYTWDPVQAGYVVSTSQRRGQGVWIITNADYGSLPLNASATQPPDANGGAGLLELKSGWNLISNPYNFPIQLGQLVGVPGSNNSAAYSFEELVNQGVISGSVAYWDPDLQTYQYNTGNSGLMESNKGYWIYVFTAQDVTMKFPPVFMEGAPGITARSAPAWNSTSSQWRLQLAARTTKSVDDQNYVGVVSDAKSIPTLQALKPPMAPTQDVAVSIDQTINGKTMKMAQAYSLKSARQQWTVNVTSVGGGQVTLTWPNITSASTNTRFRLTDLSSNATRDMRQSSGYTFTAAPNSTRQFKVEAEPAGASRAVIGDVVVTRPSRSPGAAFAISYSLSTPATTSIRVLSSSGKEVFTIASGRADNSGQNMVSWALRDNANRAVAPGIYRIEIVAETSSGDRVRKVVPVNVIR